MGLPTLVTLALLFVFAYGQTANPVNSATDTYIPHASYPYSDTFGTGPINAYRENSLTSYDEPPSTTLQVLETSLKFLAKTGLFLVGGVIFISLSIIFSYSLCSITPICTFEFNNWSTEANLKALMTPTNIARAFDIYKSAMGKYGDINAGAK